MKDFSTACCTDHNCSSHQWEYKKHGLVCTHYTSMVSGFSSLLHGKIIIEGESTFLFYWELMWSGIGQGHSGETHKWHGTRPQRAYSLRLQPCREFIGFLQDHSVRDFPLWSNVKASHIWVLWLKYLIMFLRKAPFSMLETTLQKIYTNDESVRYAS